MTSKTLSPLILTQGWGAIVNVLPCTHSGCAGHSLVDSEQHAALSVLYLVKNIQLINLFLLDLCMIIYIWSLLAVHSLYPERHLFAEILQKTQKHECIYFMHLPW